MIAQKLTPIDQDHFFDITKVMTRFVFKKPETVFSTIDRYVFSINQLTVHFYRKKCSMTVCYFELSGKMHEIDCAFPKNAEQMIRLISKVTPFHVLNPQLTTSGKRYLQPFSNRYILNS